MLGRKFYYNTIRKVVIAFGSIFNDIEIDRTDSVGNVLGSITIPFQYASKEKFISIINQYSKTDEVVTIESTLPRMGFELTGFTYAPERKTNTIEKIISRDRSVYMYNRVPYDIDFSLFIATRKIDDSFRIVEQILPYFTPEFNVKIRDMEEFEIITNVPISLKATNFQVESDGTFDERRTVLWQLDFTARAYLYAATSDAGLIKKAYVDVSSISAANNEEFGEQVAVEVSPETANYDDAYIITQAILNLSRNANVYNIFNGATMEADIT